MLPWYEKRILTLFHVCKSLSNDGVGAGKGHRISGDTAGNRFQDRRFHLGRKVWGGGLRMVERLLLPDQTAW